MRCPSILGFQGIYKFLTAAKANSTLQRCGLKMKTASLMSIHSPITLPMQSDVSLSLSFMPTDEKSYEGQLVIVSDASNAQEMTVSLKRHRPFRYYLR